MQIHPIDAQSFKLNYLGQEQIVSAQLHAEQLNIEIKGQQYQAVIENKPQALTLYTAEGQISIERFSWNTLGAICSNS